MRTYAWGLVVLTGLLPGCATLEDKPSGVISRNMIEVQATVAAIDMPTRMVTLQNSQGGVMVVEAGDEVRNLSQVRVGDVVKITYTEALAWQVKSASQGTPGVVENTVAARAGLGNTPAGRVGTSVTLTTTITGIDATQGTVTLTTREGTARTIKVANPDNLKRVRVGDLVEITYSEALAVTVTPVK
jgi:hypothetical protein